MNKYIFLTFALFVINSVNCDSSEEVINNVKSKHVKDLLNRNKEHVDDGLEKLEKHCPGVSEKLKQAVKTFQECDDQVDDSLTICQSIQSYALNCSRPLIKVVDDCLPERARGLPALGLKSLVSAADYLCKQSGESIFELANPCLWEETEEENNECDEQIHGFVDKYSDSEDIPTQSEICTTLTSLRSCIRTDTESSCKNQKTRDVAIGLFDALVAPCSNINQV